MTAVDLIADASCLSRTRIKDAMQKGAFWRTSGNGKSMRLRKAKTLLHPGERISFYYDESLLAVIPPEAKLIEDRGQYSVWDKPAGMLSQGTRYGDHCSLLRQVGQYFDPPREVFLIHRLDREASGLMILAHSKNTASRFSKLWHEGKVEKIYHILVCGNLLRDRPQGIIDTPLDGKTAYTYYHAVSYIPEKNATSVEAVIKTGRLHQIRRHFDSIGFPVMGDPRYGKGNKNTDGLKLQAQELRFECPLSGRFESFSLERTF